LAAPLPDDLPEQVSRALREDIGPGDVTALLIDAAAMARARVVCREPAVLCGTAWFEASFAQLEPRVQLKWRHRDGEQVAPDTVVCELEGPARALLTGERTALNFLQLLSATATITARYVRAVAGTACRIIDTRKTLPGLRSAQKYAVRCGGGQNHRMGLYDMVLVKENHIAAAGSIAAAVQSARALCPGLAVEVETENIKEVAEAMHISIGIDSTKLVREAMAATLRAPAFSSSVAGTMPKIFFWFGQMNTQTLNSMMVPSQAPMPITRP